MSFEVILIESGSTVATIGSADNYPDYRLLSLDFSRTHTGLSDFSLTVPYDLGLEDYILDEIHIEEDESFLFRGYLLGVENDERSGIATLTGVGIGEDLTDGATSVTYTDTLAYNAIDDYWTSYTGFTPNTIPPIPTDSVTVESSQSATTTAEFSSVASIADDEPFEVDSDQFNLLQSNTVKEGLDRDEESAFGSNTDPDFSDGVAFYLNGFSVGDYVEWYFSFPYDVPAESLGVKVRDRVDNTTNVQWSVGTGSGENFTGTVLDTIGGTTSKTLGWAGLAGSDLFNYSGGATGYTGSDIQAGTTYTLRAECVASGANYNVDVVSIFDDRLSYFFDNDNGGSSGYLDGPGLYAPATFEFDSASESWNITDASATASFNDTTNDQAMQLKVGSTGSWFPNDGTEQNTSSISTDFGSDVGSILTFRVTLGGYGSRTTATPQENYLGQSLLDYSTSFDGDSLAVITAQTLEGNHLRNLQRLHEFAGMRFTINHDQDSKTVESYDPDDVTKNLPSVVVENRNRSIDARQEYANEVTVRGKTGSGGTRPTVTLQNTSEVSAFGVKHFDKTDPTLVTEADVEHEARKLLREKTSGLDQTGQWDIQPEVVLPGYTYNLSWGDGSSTVTSLEEVSYSESGGDASGSLQFKLEDDLVTLISGLRRGTSQSFQAL